MIPHADPPVKRLADLSEQALSELKQHLAGEPVDAKRIQGLSSGAITGQVSAAGAVTAGTGWSVNRSATGTYDVTFTSAYSAAPTVVVTLTDITNHLVYAITASSTTGFTVKITSGSGSATNCSFNFVSFATV